MKTNPELKEMFEENARLEREKQAKNPKPPKADKKTKGDKKDGSDAKASKKAAGGAGPELKPGQLAELEDAFADFAAAAGGGAGGKRTGQAKGPAPLAPFDDAAAARALGRAKALAAGAAYYATVMERVLERGHGYPRAERERLQKILDDTSVSGSKPLTAEKRGELEQKARRARRAPRARRLYGGADDPFLSLFSCAGERADERGPPRAQAQARLGRARRRARGRRGRERRGRRRRAGRRERRALGAVWPRAPASRAARGALSL